MKKSLDNSEHNTFIYERDVLNKNIVKGVAEAGLLIGIILLLRFVWTWTIGFAFRGLFIEGWSPCFDIMVMPLLVRRNGILVGFCSAIACSLISFVIDSGSASAILAVNPLSTLLDYGISGPIGILVAWLCSFWVKRNNFVRWVVFATIECIVSFFGSFVSGGLYYGTFAPIGWGIWAYSGIYNILAAGVGYTFFWIVFIPSRRLFYHLDYYDSVKNK